MSFAAQSVLPPARGRLGGLFFAVAGGSALVFVAALHPLSGALGGLLYLLTGWALPTIFVVALALGIAWLIPAPLPVRLPIAVVLSLVLGVNTSLPVFADLARYRPIVSSDIRGSAVSGPERRAAVNVKSRPWGRIFVSPFGPRVRVGGNEGCGCFYFLDSTLYSDRAISALYEALGERGAVMDYSQEGHEDKDVHIDLTIWEEEDGFRALIEVFDRGEKIAAFAHQHIPLRARTERAGVGYQQFSSNFFENALDILLHANVFSTALNAVVPGYFPEHELRAFFLQASGKR